MSLKNSRGALIELAFDIARTKVSAGIVAANIEVTLRILY